MLGWLTSEELVDHVLRSRSVIDCPPTKVHVFRARRVTLGRLRIGENLGESFWVTDPARTVIDAYRLRHQIGRDPAHVALREYLRSGRKRTRLAELTQPLRAWTPPTNDARRRSTRLYTGVRIVVPARLDRARCPLRVDVNGGDPVTPALVETDFPG